MDRDDLEGYLVGVSRRLEERTAAHGPDPALVEELAAARKALHAGRLSEADRKLRALDARLDADRPEVEMQDHPRGLIGYVPKGDRGVPPTAEEEPLANRIRLIGRLATVRAAEGRDVTVARRLLTEAQAAYDAGDRPLARRKVDDAHRRLDPDPPDAASRRPSGPGRA